MTERQEEQAGQAAGAKADPRIGRGQGPAGAEAVAAMEARLGGVFGPLGEALRKIKEATAAARSEDGDVPDGEASVASRAGAASPEGPGPASEPPRSRRPETRWGVEEGATLLMIELPGVAAEALFWRVAGGGLRLESDGSPRFLLTMGLPAALAEIEPEGRYRNGLLTLRFPDD
ncbi:MAG: hypothetical protein AAF416_12675 [Pseudomonadota bacterium]